MKKTHKLYYKFILAYVCFAALCVIVVLTITSPITYTFLVRQKAADMYRAANEISNTYAGFFYDDAISAEDVKKQLKVAGDYFELLDFLQRLRKEDRFYQLKQIKVDAKEGAGRLEAEMLLVMFAEEI